MSVDKDAPTGRISRGQTLLLVSFLLVCAISWVAWMGPLNSAHTGRERVIVEAALGYSTGDLQPHRVLKYGTVAQYVLAVAFAGAATVHGESPSEYVTRSFYDRPAEPFVIGRALGVLFVLLIMLVMLRGGRRLFGPQQAYWALAFFGLPIVAILREVPQRIDVVLALFQFLALLHVVSIARRQWWRSYLWAGLWIGLSIGTKPLPALPIIALLLTAHGVAFLRFRVSHAKLGSCLLMVLGVAVLSNPASILHFDQFVEAQMGAFSYAQHLVEFGELTPLWKLPAMVVELLGWPILVMSIVAIGWGLAQPAAHLRLFAAFVLLFVLAHGAVGLWSNHLIVVVAPLCLLSGAFCVRTSERIFGHSGEESVSRATTAIWFVIPVVLLIGYRPFLAGVECTLEWVNPPHEPVASRVSHWVENHVDADVSILGLGRMGLSPGLVMDVEQRELRRFIGGRGLGSPDNHARAFRDAYARYVSSGGSTYRIYWMNDYSVDQSVFDNCGEIDCEVLIVNTEAGRQRLEQELVERAGQVPETMLLAEFETAYFTEEPTRIYRIGQ